MFLLILDMSVPVFFSMTFTFACLVRPLATLQYYDGFHIIGDKSAPMSTQGQMAVSRRTNDLFVPN